MISLILALVAGIQPREVLRAMDSPLRRETSFRLADARRLDPRHKGEDEGWWRVCRMKESWERLAQRAETMTGLRSSRRQGRTG
jgi:cell wall assembly regulator SMI1